MVEINVHYFIFLPVIIFLSMFLPFHLLSKRIFSFHFIDIAFIVLFSFSLLNIVFASTLFNLNNEFLICFLIMVMLYLILRTSSSWVVFYFLPILFSVFFVLELCLGIHQLFANANTKSSLSLLIQGSLQNSGVYSFYLIINLPLFFYSLNIVSDNKVIKKASHIITLLIVIIILYVTKSRTAMIVLLVFGMCQIVFINAGSGKKNFRLLKNNWIIFSFISVILVGCCAYLVIKIKPDSFYGRLLIWKITINHLWENFWVGVGLGNFPFYYPKWQIEYFSSHHNIPEFYFLNADETHIAFNEFLQILMETGIVGIVFFLFLVIYLLHIKSAVNKKYILSIKTTVILILSACLFSYPLHCNAILFLFFICIATLLSSQKLKTYNFISGRAYQFIVLISFECLLIFTALKSMKECNNISKWNILREDVFMNDYQIRSKYSALYPLFKTNGKFLLDMGEQLSYIDEILIGIKILEESKLFYFSTRSLLSTANAYYQKGDLQNAIKNLEALSNLVPHKFYPKYELTKLYYKTGDSTKGRTMAKLILTMPVKKMSSDVIRIKKETTEILNEANK